MTYRSPKYITYGENKYVAPNGSYYSTAGLALTQYGIHISRFYVVEDITVTSLAVQLTTAVAASNVDLGIFNSGGFLLATTGPTASTTTSTISKNLGGTNSLATDGTSSGATKVSSMQLYAGTVYYLAAYSDAAITVGGTGATANQPSNIIYGTGNKILYGLVQQTDGGLTAVNSGILAGLIGNISGATGNTVNITAASVSGTTVTITTSTTHNLSNNQWLGFTNFANGSGGSGWTTLNSDGYQITVTGTTTFTFTASGISGASNVSAPAYINNAFVDITSVANTNRSLVSSGPTIRIN